MSEAVSTAGVMTRAKVAVMEKKAEVEEPPQSHDSSKNDHKQEGKEVPETIIEAEVVTDEEDGEFMSRYCLADP